MPSIATAETVAAAPAADEALPDVVVTANRREQNLQMVPTSVTALGATQLKDLGITTTTQVSQFVAGLQLVSPNTGTDNFYSIRGATQNDYAEQQESPVAAYMDGVYLSQSAGTATLLFDTARVEVLRGPQGTLFGRNATAGLVQYISVQPSKELDGYAEVTLGNYNSKHLEGAIGDGVTDALSVRLSLAADYADPFLTNTIGHGDNPGNSNSRAGRLQIRYQPIDDLDVTLNLHAGGQKVHAGFYKDLISYPDPNNHDLSTILPGNLNFWGTCPGCDRLGYKVPASYDYYTGAADTLGHNYESTIGSTITIKYRFGGLNLTSISDVTKYNKDYTEDSESSPLVDSTFWTAVNTLQMSQEVHLDNGGEGRLRWVTGVYYLSIHGRYREGEGTAFADQADSGVAYTGSEDNYTIDTNSWSVFAQSEYDILDDLTAVIGGRWAHEEKNYYYRFNDTTGTAEYSPFDPTIPPLYVNPTVSGDAAKVRKGDWSGKVALNYHLTDDIMPYASWSRGIKPGGFNAPLYELSSPYQYRFSEEKLYATELGVKSEFLNHKVRVNADVFYYDYVG